MFDKKKEETAAPEPSDLAAGIPSVAGKRSTGSKQSAFLLFAACVVVGFIGIAAWQFKGTLLGSDEAEVVPENDLNVYTSSKTLTVPPVPPKRAEPKPEPDPVVKEEPEEKPPLPTTPPPLPVQPVAVAQPVQPQKQEPTLEERRFAAPLMSANSDGPSAAPVQGAPDDMDSAPRGDGGRLGSMLSAVDTPGVRARRMPNRTFLLPKGTFIDCILETKVDTTVPGMTSCVIPRPLYSADGKVLLIERGSKVIGEYKGAVENGLNRIFFVDAATDTDRRAHQPRLARHRRNGRKRPLRTCRLPLVEALWKRLALQPDPRRLRICRQSGFRQQRRRQLLPELAGRHGRNRPGSHASVREHPADPHSEPRFANRHLRGPRFGLFFCLRACASLMPRRA